MLNGGRIRSSVVHYEYALAFKNLAVVLLVIWFLQYLFYCVKGFIKIAKVFYIYFKSERVRKLYRTIIYEKKNDVIDMMKRLFLSLCVIVFIIFLLGLIKIPKRLIATNVMSLKSWFNVLDLYLNQIVISFKYGFYNIRRDFLLMATLMTLVYTRFYHTYKDKQVRHEK